VPTKPDSSWRHTRLRTWLTLVTLLSSALLAFTLAALRTAQLSEQALAAASELNLQQARGVAAAVDADLERFGQELQAQAALMEEVSALRQPALLQKLVERLHARPCVAWAGVTDARGRVLAALDGLLLGVDVSARDWWQSAQRGLHFGDVHEAKLLAKLLPAPHSGEPWRFVDIAVPLHDGAGRVGGVLALHLSWPWLRDRIALFAGTTPAQRAQLFIAGPGGNQRLGPSGAMGDVLPLQQAAAQAPQGSAVLTWPDGRRYLTAWSVSRASTPYARLGWVTAVRTPMDELQAGNAAALRWIWGAAALGVAGTTALAWLLASLLLLPVHQFVARVRGMADRENAAPPPPLLPAEFAQLHEVVLELVGRLGQKEAALRQALEHVRGGFDNVGRAMPGILFTRVQRGQDAHYTFISEAARHYLGVSREELMADRSGLLWARHVDEDDARRVTAQLAQAMADGMPLTHSYRVCGGDGCWRTLRLTMVPREGGSPQERIFDGFAIDITDLVQARAQALQASRAKSDFLAHMSHEIRTPMNAILGLSHLLAQDALAPRHAQQLAKIEGAAQHLLSIINDILDLSRIEAGKLQLEERNFDLVTLLEQVRSIVGAGAAAKGLDVEVDTGDVPACLRGDETRVRQALLNYAGNAVKFTAAGSITLRARLEEERDARLLVRFEVEDTGVGIEAQQVARLFEAFEQAQASTTREHGGTGLGLAITRRLADLMDGSAGAQPRPGGGSVFWFTAWLGHGAGAPAPEAAPAQADAALRQRHAGARVLVAEDHFINREVALAMLRNAGLEVDTAEDGRVATEKVRQGNFDLVLMDVHMPVMDGLQATRALRALPDLQTLPILAMTANAFDDDRTACLAAGMDDFVSKPVEPQSLYAALLKWLDHRRGYTA
jgi:signal transduction histidine kinase/ActR/RegA family two-component response regulator